MANVTFDDRSFILDGKRVWLVSGSIHYFRAPAALWRDRLLKAKRAGLNCIETVVPWNFHEPAEGQWDFAGDRDVAGFIRLAGELGLYVILRPGPYIGSDWDFGGLPAWLTTKTGITYRTTNASYTHYFDKYFRQLLPRLADLQITRGGNILLVQNENEYYMTTQPDRLSYLEFISQLIRRSGFDIPILTCNLLSNPPVPDAVECLAGWGREVQEIKLLRSRQPYTPKLVAEFRVGGADCWGQEHRRKSPRETARRAMEILGSGAQFNYSPWHGGTNFAFWGGRRSRQEAQFVTTTYDCDAPLAEGGALTPKYYLTRLVNLPAATLGESIAACHAQSLVNTHDGVSVLNLTGSQGGFAVVTHNGKEDQLWARVSLPDGMELETSLAAFGAALLPVNLSLSPSHKLQYSSLAPLGFFGDKLLVLHGPVGSRATYCLNAAVKTLDVPKGEDVVLNDHQGVIVAVMNSDLAMRTWPLEESLILGPDFVGETADDISSSASTYAVLNFQGQLQRKKVKPAPRAETLPKLSPIKKLGMPLETLAGETPFLAIPRPRDVDQLGQYYGYLWYQLEIPQTKAGNKHLLFSHCEDRAHLWLNGAPLGVWGRGNGATLEPLAAHFKAGVNVLTAMVDNLGRFCRGSRLGELKGLHGHIYDAKPLKIAPKLRPSEEPFSRRLIPRALSHLSYLEHAPMMEARIEVSLQKVLPLHFSFAQLPHHAVLFCNDRLVNFYENFGENFGSATLTSELRKGKNVLRLILWGQVDPKSMANLKLHLLQENLSQDAKWSYRPWTKCDGKLAPAKANMPTWFSSSFKCSPTAKPLFLSIAPGVKGQLYLNGHNLGRFWTLGPQQDFYLPQPFLREQNELLLFEEDGQSPRCKLEFRPAGPFGE